MKGSGTPAAPKPRHGLAAAVLAAVAVAAYANSFGAGFLQDNRYLIIGDARVQEVSARNLGLIFSETALVAMAPTDLYRPVTTLSYLFNYAVLGNGQDPAGYHLVNLALHAGNAFLVYLLALVLLGEFRPALFTAAIWALHPAATEAVTNIIGRADELAAMAVLGSLLLYIRSTTAAGREKWRWLALSIAVFTAGLLAKENAAVVPGLAILYDLTFRFSIRKPGAGILRSLKEGCWLFAPPLAAVWCVRQVVFAHSPPVVIQFLDNPLVGADLFTVLMTVIKVMGKYLWLLLWPASLSCDYSYNQVPLATGLGDWQALLALAALLGLCAVAVVCCRREGRASRAVFFFIAASALMMAPMSNLPVRIGAIMADRFLYLPGVGFAACVVVAVDAACRRLRLRPGAPAVALCVIAAAFGLRTISRNPDWNDEQSLWTSAAAAAPGSFKVHFSLSYQLAQKQPLAQYIDEAISEAEKGLAIVSGLPDRLNLATVFLETARRYNAKAELQPAPESLVWYRKAAQTLVRGWAVDREADAAQRAADLARGISPDRIPTRGYEELYRLLGQTWLRLSDGTNALAAFQYERRLNPLSPEIYGNIGRAYLASGHATEAAISFLQSQILRESDQDTPEALALYRMMDPAGCAITERNGRPAVNFGCPLVRGHACAAFADLVRGFREAHLDKVAAAAIGVARERYGCAAVVN